jgi:hypothetical protein
MSQKAIIFVLMAVRTLNPTILSHLMLFALSNNRIVSNLKNHYIMFVINITLLMATVFNSLMHSGYCMSMYHLL